MQPAQHNAPQLLVRAAEGDSRAAEELIPLAYHEWDELRRLAQSLLGGHERR